jgi:hypothetical protein
MNKKTKSLLLFLIGFSIVLVSIMRYSAVKDGYIYFIIAVFGTFIGLSPIFLTKKIPSSKRVLYFTVLCFGVGVLIYFVMVAIGFSDYQS